MDRHGQMTCNELKIPLVLLGLSFLGGVCGQTCSNPLTISSSQIGEEQYAERTGNDCYILLTTTKIKEEAFKQCENVVQIVIPHTVTEIKSKVFEQVNKDTPNSGGYRSWNIVFLCDPATGEQSGCGACYSCWAPSSSPA